MKTAAYTKTAIISLLLAFESYFLTTILLKYVQSGDYFTPPLKTLGVIVGLLLVVLYTYSLTVGAWDKWEQFVVVPLPISVGVFVAFLLLNPTYALLSAIVVYGLVCYDVAVATILKNQMIKFNPRVVLRFSSRGLLFLFAFLSSLMVLLHSANQKSKIDLTDKISQVAQKQAEKMIQPKIDGDAPNLLLTELEGKAIPPDPELFGMLGGLQGDNNSVVTGLPSFNLDLKDTVKNEVNRIVEPYQAFIPPLIAIVVYALIRFLGAIAYAIFSLTIGLVFTLAKKTNLLHVNFETVDKENLSFIEKIS